MKSCTISYVRPIESVVFRPDILGGRLIIQFMYVNYGECSIRVYRSQFWYEFSIFLKYLVKHFLYACIMLDAFSYPLLCWHNRQVPI